MPLLLLENVKKIAPYFLATHFIERRVVNSKLDARFQHLIKMTDLFAVNKTII